MGQPVRILIVGDSAFMRLAMANRVASLPEVASTLVGLVK